MFFHSKVAGSRLTWPIALAYGVAVCMLSRSGDSDMLLQGAGILVATILITLLSNAHSLIRVFSRMCPCIFLLLSVMTMPLTRQPKATWTLLLFLLYLYFIFYTYQRRDGTGITFVANICLGVASLLFVQILYLMPFLWVLTATRLQAASARNYVATVLGLLLPYWFWVAYLMWSSQMPLFVDHFTALAQFMPVADGLTEPHLLASTIVIVFLYILALAHFLRFSYNDNIKTLMMHLMLVWLCALALIFLILQPQHKDYLLGIIIACSSPLQAHLFTFAKNQFVSILFMVTLAVIVALTIFNTWIG